MSTIAGTTITMAGGNLFKLAAQAYGDSSQWNRIAAANGLWDFLVVGTVTLAIPPANASAGNGGILGV
jgi:nucleoid-associated protein YgaU